MPAHSSASVHSSARRSTAAFAALTLVVGLVSVAFGATDRPRGDASPRLQAPVFVDEEFLVPEDNLANWPSDVWIVQLNTPALALHPDAVRTPTGRLDVAASTLALEAIEAEQDSVVLAISEALGRTVAIESITSGGDLTEVEDGEAVTYEFRYRHAFNGFAIRMSREEADIVAALPAVRQIQANHMRFPTTDAGPEWIGADAIWAGDANTADPCGTEPAAPETATGEPYPGGTCGEGMLVGIVDSGVNTNHLSFDDPGPVDGYDHFNNDPAPAPSVTGYYGSCAVAGQPYCNDKLIGAYDFSGSAVGPEDENGHGSHTASTTAGNVVSADLDFPTVDYPDVPLSGVAPHANIISYKACIYPFVADAGACTQQQTVLAIDQAVADGVDVINYSIGGGPSDPYVDSDSLAFLAANEAGVFGSVSAGNDGPGPGTVGSPANSPWVMTVAASSHGRAYLNGLIGLTATSASMPAPADDEMEGRSITSGTDPARPIVWAGDEGFRLCAAGTTEASVNPFVPGQFTGQIVVCERSLEGQPGGRVQKCDNVRAAGAAGCVLINQQPQGNSIVADTHTLPAVHLTADQGDLLLAWLIGDRPDADGNYNRESGDEGDEDPAEAPTGQIPGTILDEDPRHGDVMAGFSSRGPNTPLPDVIKPDVTGPGVDITAAWRDLPSDNPPTPLTGGTEFNVISGTSMSSPHDAGAAALVLALHPEWTPDQVKSAMMTTAFTEPPGAGAEIQPVMNDDFTLADPFDMGAGRIDVSLAVNAGLVLDEEAAAYTESDPGLTEPGDPTTLNLASFGDASCETTCSWTRSVTSTVAEDVTWTPAVAGEGGLVLTVSPSPITVPAGETVDIQVTADVTGVEIGGWTFGEVQLIPDVEGIPVAHFPVAVLTPGQGVPTIALHFHGNGHAPEGGEAGEIDCTGIGNEDGGFCNGPFLLESPEIYEGEAAVFQAVQPVNGAGHQNPYDPNFKWCVGDDEVECPAGEGPRRGPTTVRGPMTVKWWASSAPAGQNPGIFGQLWVLRLYADGELAYTSGSIGAVPAEVGVPDLLEATVVIPEITAEKYITLHVDVDFATPGNTDEQVNSVYYDGTSAPSDLDDQGVQDAHDGTCCDSIVLMPVVGLQQSPSPAPTATAEPTAAPTATAAPTGTVTASPAATTSPTPRIRFIPDTAGEWAAAAGAGGSLLVLIGSIAILAAGHFGWKPSNGRRPRS